jgi:hypothetical protein
MLADALALAAALSWAAPGGVGGPAIEIHPATLLLGSGEKARVVVRSPGGAPRLVASAGRLEPAREIEPGVFEAVLEPPAEAYPQLAIVAALGPAGVAFAGLPLVGRGTAVARTQPHARITVEIRGRIFGPATADGAGVAEVPVEVPPGVTFALHRGKPLDLRVPPLRQTLLVVEPRPLRADRDDVVMVYAFAATPAGAAWVGAPLTLSASAGSLGPARVVAPGALAAEWTLPPGPAGSVRIEVRLPSGPPAVQELPRPAGPPARIAIRLGAERLRAGGPPVDVVVEMTDAAGNRAAGDVRIAASFGEVSAPVRDASGAVHASLRVPERLEGRAEAVIEARVGEVAGRRGVALAPAAAERIAVALERSELTADGRAASGVSISIADRFGNGVDEPAPEIGAGRGKVLAASRVGPGAYRSRYAPRWLREGGEDAVVVRAGDLVASAPVRLVAPPHRLGITARAGAVHAEGGFTAPLVAAAVEGWPFGVGDRLGLSLGLARVASGRTGRLELGGSLHAVETSSELWALEATALARRQLSGRLTATGGAGVRAVRVHSGIEIDGARVSDEWGWAPGVQAQAGVAWELPSWHARIGLDLLAAWQDSAGMHSFRGSLATLGLALGVSHDAL